MDVDDQAAGEVDSFLAEVEEKEELEEWIVHDRTNIEKCIIRHQLNPQLKKKEVTLTRIIRKKYDNDRKCGGCNWPATVLYSFPQIKRGWICTNCMMDLIVDDKRFVETVSNE